MTLLAVLPSIHRPWTLRCFGSMHSRLQNSTIVVDNTVVNLGVAASWNVGARRVLADDHEWLVIVSAACRFGAPRGMDFLRALDDNEDAIAVEAAHGIGWHLIAFNRRVLQEVGLFDENFWPAYYEDLDYSYRIQLWMGSTPTRWSDGMWPKVSVDVAIAGFSHGVDLGGAVVDNDKLRAYYKRKWSGEPGHETFTAPFGSYPLGHWVKEQV